MEKQKQKQDINITEIINAIEDFDNSFAAFDKFVKAAEKNLGEDWRKTVKDKFLAATEDEKAESKITKIFNYESALNVWTKAQKILKNPNDETITDVFINDADKWLPYFGIEGRNILNSLNEIFSKKQKDKQKVLFKQTVFEHSPTPPSNLAELEKDIEVEVLWQFNNFLLLKDYYDRTIARISARCIRMGNLTLEEYPHFNYVLDLLDEICTASDVIIKHNELGPLIEARVSGGKDYLMSQIRVFKKEFDRNASPEMIRKAYNLDEIRKTLGKLDKDDDVFKQQDVTKGAGENADDVISKLLKSQNIQAADIGEDEDLAAAPVARKEEKTSIFSSKKKDAK
jgi:hypothetical protein